MRSRTLNAGSLPYPTKGLAAKQVDESKLKQRLNQLWSFSFLPNGTELFRQDIHELVSDIVDLTRGGAMDNKDYCQALVCFCPTAQGLQI